MQQLILLEYLLTKVVNFQIQVMGETNNREFVSCLCDSCKTLADLSILD